MSRTEESTCQRSSKICTSIRWLNGVMIPPGGQVSLPVQLKLGKRMGLFTKTLIVRSNTVPEPNLLLSIKGEVFAKPVFWEKEK